MDEENDKSLYFSNDLQLSKTSENILIILFCEMNKDKYLQTLLN